MIDYSAEEALTPNRRSVLQLYRVEPWMVRPAQRFAWEGSEIATVQGSGRFTPAGRHVFLLPGEVWSLEPLGGSVANLLNTEYTAAPGTTSNTEAAPSVQMINTYFKPTETGLAPSGDLVDEGGPVWVKRRAAGESWDDELFIDVAAFPKVPEDWDAPMKRVLKGSLTTSQYPANCGYGVMFEVHPNFYGGNALLNFYFGGAADVTPPGTPDAMTSGGEYCLSINGYGYAILYELAFRYNEGREWQPRGTFKYAVPDRGKPTSHIIEIIPLGKNRIAFLAGTTDRADTGRARYTSPGGEIHTAIFTEVERKAGHRHLKEITGEGEPRLDIREGYRHRFAYWRILYPPLLEQVLGGLLVGEPFVISELTPEGTVMTLRLDGLEPGDSTLSAAIVDADTGIVCDPGPDPNTFLTTESKTYYVAYSFLSSTNRLLSPLLFRAEVEVAGQEAEQSADLKEADLYGQVSIVGPGTEPGFERLDAMVEDLTASLPLLRTRSEIRGRLLVKNPTDSSRNFVAWDGIVVRNPGIQRGFAGSTFPSEDWKEYNLIGTGMWHRVEQYQLSEQYRLDKDPLADRDANGNLPAKKVKRTVYELLEMAGFPQDQLTLLGIDADEDPLRFFIAKGEDVRGEAAYLDVGVSPAPFLRRISRMLLDSFLVWDPAAGPHGRWRLVPNPLPPYTPLWNFVTEYPAGKMPTHWGSYPAKTTWVERYTTYTIPPECNNLVVQGMFPQGPRDKILLGQVEANNPRSWNKDPLNPTANPDHPDYLGVRVRNYFYDPNQQTAEGVAYCARILGRQILYAQQVVEIDAPLFPVTDESDIYQTQPRPLRAGDPITFQGEDYVVLDNFLHWEHDWMQWQSILAQKLEAVGGGLG